MARDAFFSFAPRGDELSARFPRPLDFERPEFVPSSGLKKAFAAAARA